MKTNDRVRTISLVILALFYLTMLGGGTYEQLNVTRMVASAPPASLYMLKGEYRFSPLLFWGTFRPLTILAFIGAIILNWRSKGMKRNLLFVAFGIDVIVTIWTYLYFAPETAVIVESDPTRVDPGLVERTQQWYHLNFIRLGAFYIAGICLLTAVSTRDYRLGME